MRSKKKVKFIVYRLKTLRLKAIVSSARHKSIEDEIPACCNYIIEYRLDFWGRQTSSVATVIPGWRETSAPISVHIQLANLDSR